MPELHNADPLTDGTARDGADEQALREPARAAVPIEEYFKRFDGEELTIIRPKSGWQPVDLQEMWRYRELLYFLIWRDLKVRYQQTIMGAAWAVIQPVVNMLVFSVIFGKFAGMPSDNVPYPIFVYAGLLPWGLLQGAVTEASGSLIGQANLLTKIYFPRLLAPMAKIGGRLTNFLLSFLVYLLLMAWYQILPGPTIVLLPLLVLLTIFTALGIGCIFASLSVAYRDFGIIVPFVTQIWMYVSPVIYPPTLLPEQYRWILSLNPMTGIIQAFRASLMNQSIDWFSLGLGALISTVLFVFGLFYFRRCERRFADII